MPPLLDNEDIAPMLNSPKAFARHLFREVMRRVDVPESMRATVFVVGERLHVGPHQFDLRLFERLLLVSVGKAAVPMAEHVLQTLHGAGELRGVVVGPGVWEAPEGIAYFQGDHPVPYARSLAAAEACLELVRTADERCLVLFLISGGASAMVEAPLDRGISPADLSTFYQQILHSGLPIGPANTLRKHFSAIKGGRLALAAGAATRCTVLISDVPDGKLDVVGSGPSLADTSTVEECRILLAEVPSFRQLPTSISAFTRVMPETPKSLPEGRMLSGCFSLLSSRSLLQAATALAAEAGYRVVVDNECDDWDYREAARYLVARAQTEMERGSPVCVLSAGEVTIAIQGEAGVGGRNQQWALETARLIRGDARLVAMSVGSDGVDGNSPAAGAVVDGTTWQRASAAGLDPARALEEFDAYPLFAALSDAITPGPSGNNIRDLRVIFGNTNRLQP